MNKPKTRPYGHFPCDYPQCSKTFSRPDHLRRHKKNHQSPQFQCKFPGCSLTFVRSDVRDKHSRRHANAMANDSAMAHDTSSSGTVDRLETLEDDGIVASTISGTNGGMNGTNDSMSYGYQASRPMHGSNGSIHGSMPRPGSLRGSDTVNGAGTIPGVPGTVPGKPLSPSDLIEWLFDPITSSEPFQDFHGVSPISLLDSMFAISPNFPHAINRTTVSEGLRQSLVALIPSLDLNFDFGLSQIQRCLEIYWLIYHPQYPLLHKPSFSNEDSPPLLLLAMIMLGAAVSPCTGFNEKPVLRDPQALAMEIARPLRWLIFANKDCRPPAKTWVIQSLLLLETFEITSSSRELHERAYLHHGSKIQLLRRSPILGGDPLKDDDEDGAPPNHIWKKWIEVESMKRATLMAFYLDTVNATVYGHLVILYAHQIKISLPCEDELWEFDNSKQIESKLINDKPPKFLNALKRLLHRQKVGTSSFGRKILLAGLLTIMFQMQQRDLQLSFLEWNRVKESWNETISLAIDVWRTEICVGNCCHGANSFSAAASGASGTANGTANGASISADGTVTANGTNSTTTLPPMLRDSDTRCKFSLYHISQIYMRITHYDYIIFAGAPSRMNVTAGDQEYAVVSKRVVQWAQSLNGRISVVHAYLFLFEMMLSPENPDVAMSYDPNTDPFLHRKNIMASAILVVFAYNFVLYGPESDLLSDESSLVRGEYPQREDGYAYLKRIRRDLSSVSGLPPSFTYHSSTSSEFHDNITLLASKVPQVTNLHHIVGLLKVFWTSYATSQWEIGVEYARLFENCVERCLGRKTVVCEGMYARGAE